MLLDSKSFNGDLLTPYRYTHKALRALRAGNLALLAERSSKELMVGTSIAELLLSQSSTAIMHIDLEKGSKWDRPILMAINYHGANSEAEGKIVVQDPLRVEDGQYILDISVGKQEKTFYKRSDWLSPEPHPFETEPVNPLKVRYHYVHCGASDAARQSFMEAGYVFSDELLLPSWLKWED